MLNHLDTVIGFVVVLLGISMLITILTQIAAAALGLRGTNLKWGITTLLETLDPSLKMHAEEISRQVLQHPLISDSTVSRFKHLPFVSNRWSLANAITGDELLKILRLLASTELNPAAGGARDETEAGRKALATLSEALKQIDPQAQTVEDATKKILEVTQSLKEQLPSELGEHLAKIDELAQQAVSGAGKVIVTTTQEMADLKHWFDAMMGRVSQRFTFQTRLWTVLFSVLIAFGIHLDAVDLFKRLSTDAELRGQLAASTDTMRNHAEILLASTPAASNQNASQEEMKARIDGLKMQAVAIKQELENNKFQLIPSPYPGWNGYQDLKHFFGVLASAALLSLGAPFWFNALKTFGNLKPVVANKIEKQQNQDQPVNKT